jgi:chemotaxis protein methyltransferase WspC
MLQASVEALIKRQTGIDASIVGSGLIRSAIERRMRVHQISGLANYWQLLQQNAAAVQQLVEAVVVPETWFFRDRSPFDFLVKSIKTRKLSPAQPLQILSVPCSTGEEPYSIAMALLQAGIPTTQFHIDAIDISQQNIKQAHAGIYTPFSFRNDDADLKAAFFTSMGDAYQLHDRVKRLVQFRVGNILAAQTWPIDQAYDIIFCRNLLIYFDPETRQQVLRRLTQLLKPTGLLFVGHAESSLLLNAGWQGVRVPFTFAYQKPTPPNTKSIDSHNHKATTKTISKMDPTTAAAPTIATADQTANHQPTNDQPTNDQSASTINHLPVDRLEQARQLADRGELAAAHQICLQQLEGAPLQPEVYLLLGQIHQAQNQDSMAETYFKKTLYLQPHSTAALTHLARLKQQRGENAAAQRLLNRIDRLKLE